MDQNYKRDGNNIFTSVTINFRDAILGCKIPLKTLTKTVMLTVPAGTQPETVLKLKKQGLAVGESSGDMFVTVKVEIPKELTDKQKQLLEQWDT